MATEVCIRLTWDGTRWVARCGIIVGIGPTPHDALLDYVIASRPVR